MQVLKFKLHGETEFPQDLIDDAPSQGQFDDYAEYVLETYDVQVTLDDAIRYLSGYGAWEDKELRDDIELTKARLLWLSILDCKENNTNYFYMGE